MLRAIALVSLACLVAAASGCRHPSPLQFIGEERPKTLLSWAAGRAEPEEDDKSEREEKEIDGKENGDKKVNSDSPVKQAAAEVLLEPNSPVDRGGSAPEEEDVIVTDRPDFTEASSTVGRGRQQLEAGWTYSSKAQGAGYVKSHTYPEMLFRIGLFADWFELRIGQFWNTTIDTSGAARVDITGAEDLYLGVKLGLTEQKKFLPEAALILQMTVPTGAGFYTNGQVLPGFNLLYGWDVTERISAGGSTQINRRLNGIGQYYAEIATSATTGLSITKRLGGYFEWFSLMPIGSVEAGAGAETYIDGGLTFKVTNNFQLDIRAGKGLSTNADDYFAGAGFAIRR